MDDSNTIYIKSLVAKFFKKELTAEEVEELAVKRAEMTEDEYDALVVEVLIGLEGQLPEGFLKTWSPDYEAILKEKSIYEKEYGESLVRKKVKGA